MVGFDLKEGACEEREVSEDELWSAYSCVFLQDRGMIRAINSDF